MVIILEGSRGLAAAYNCLLTLLISFGVAYINPIRGDYN